MRSTTDLISAFQQHFVGKQRDEFAVRGLFGRAVDLDTENTIYIFDFAPIPSYFDSVADCALDLAGGSIKLLRNGRIQAFGNGIYYRRIVDGKLDALAQELISLDMCGNANAYEDAADTFVKRAFGNALLPYRFTAELSAFVDVENALFQHVVFDGFDKIIFCAEL